MVKNCLYDIFTDTSETPDQAEHVHIDFCDKIKVNALQLGFENVF